MEFLRLINPPSHYHESTVGAGVFAGGQGDQFVAIFRGDSGVVVGQLLAGGNKFIKFRFCGGIDEVVVAEALTHGGGGGKSRGKYYCGRIFCI